MAADKQSRFLTVEQCCSADFGCEGTNPADLCVYGEVSPGHRVTLLGDKNKLCYAKTGEHTVIIDGMGESPGTALTDIDCEKRGGGTIAVINEVVEDYEKLDFQSVKDSSSITVTDKEIRKRGLLDGFSIASDAKPKMYSYPYPGRKVYFVLYEPQPLILINNDSYDLLSDNRECLNSSVISTFRLNKRYYAKIGRCACETDACGEEYIEIKKDAGT